MSNPDYFDHDYTHSNDYFDPSAVFCMRCAVKVMDIGVIEVTNPRNHSENVLVQGRRKLANYRLLPVYVEIQGAKAPSDLVVCADCVNLVQITDETRPKINRQVIDAHRRSVEWTGRTVGDRDPILSYNVLELRRN